MVESSLYMITSEKKQGIITDLRKHDKDGGSPAVQVGVLTERIKELTGHLQTNKKDHMARRGLLQMVGARKRHLKYIASKDSQEYLNLIKKLGLRR